MLAYGSLLGKVFDNLTRLRLALLQGLLDRINRPFDALADKSVRVDKHVRRVLRLFCGLPILFADFARFAVCPGVYGTWTPTR